ncbi:L-fuculose kinase fucK [Streptococcus pneumoniae]|nr:L-fuculose kinase fucK [Streptococcus pneumoniae]
MEAVLAIDLGATSGRAIVGYLSENKLVTQIIHTSLN